MLHWLVASLLLVNFATGFRVAPDALDADWSRAVAAAIGPQGAVLFWHVASACALLAAVAAYATYLMGARQIARLRMDADRLRDLRSPDRRRRWRSVNVLIYWLAYALLATAACTRLLMFSGVVNRAHWGVGTIHRLVAWSLVGYVVLHVTAQITMAGWRALYAITVPRPAYGRAAVAAGVTAAVAAAGLYALDALTVRNLEMAHVSDPARVDGDFDDPAWRAARPVTIQTAGGANLIAGGTAATVRAVRDDTTRTSCSSGRIRRAASSRSRCRRRRRAGGWSRTDSPAPTRRTTKRTRSPSCCRTPAGSRRFARSISVPVRLTDCPEPPESAASTIPTTEPCSMSGTGRPFRTNPLGLAEDDYFGQPQPPQPDAPLERYAAGYAPDPAVNGSSINNWRDLLEGPYSRRFDGGVVPRFLPNASWTSNPANLDPGTLKNTS